MSKVYAKVDAQGRVTAIDGGYTACNIGDMTGWVQVDEGEGDRYNLCQGNYLPLPLMTDEGVHRYKLQGGAVVERTQAELDADAAALPAPALTDAERIAALEEANASLEQQLALLLSGEVE